MIKNEKRKRERERSNEKERNNRIYRGKVKSK